MLPFRYTQTDPKVTVLSALHRFARISSATILAKYSHLEFIRDWREWRVNAANANTLAHTLFSQCDRALLFRKLATLQTDILLFDDVEQLRWKGPTPAFAHVGARFDGAVADEKASPSSGSQSKRECNPN